MSQTIIEVDLKDLLAKIDNRLDRIEQKLEVLPRLETKLDGLERRVGRLEDSQNKQIWALVITVIGATVAAAVKFGWFPNA
ncbi:MAG: hypothetical protein VKN60_00160 [Cyanobacteriota bacterium]|nr:hypothetical protein [Cyanobacteriota bacterium]